LYSPRIALHDPESHFQKRAKDKRSPRKRQGIFCGLVEERTIASKISFIADCCGTRELACFLFGQVC